MGKKEILVMAIKKAEKNGYKCMHNVDDITEIEIDKFPENFYSILFSIDFAKCFFGDSLIESECVCAGDESSFLVEEWKVCLQEMVISDDKLKYIQMYL